MDESTAEDTRNKKRARRPLTTPSSAGAAAATAAAAVDRISGLDDDVLLHVLSLLPDARDAVRTGALSRRWLGLWKRAPALSFVSRSVWEATDVQERAALARYAASVDGVLAQRAQSGSGCAIEGLSISYATRSPYPGANAEYRNGLPAASVDAFPSRLGGHAERDGERFLERLIPASVDAIQRWIRYAFQHGVKSFSVDMRLPYFWTHFVYGADGVRSTTTAAAGVVFLDDVLPDSAPAAPPVRLEAMRLALGGARLRLPAAGAAMEFTSLVDLSLEWIMMEAGSVRLLARLLSSASCPRLQKLRLGKLCLLDALDEEMVLEAGMLLELRIQDVKFLSLKLRTPRLKVLHLHQHWHQPLTVSAPRLEEVEVSFPQGSPLGWLQVDGDLPRVRSLKICMKSHRCHSRCDGEAEAQIDTNVQLLKRCSSLTSLDVTLTGREPIKGLHVDIIKSRVPHLPHITSLSVNISPWLGHNGFGAGVANLLTRFDNLRSLSLHLPFLDHKPASGLDILCNQQYHWKYNKFSMAQLREVELTGCAGTDCEFWFMKTVLARAKRLHNVAISFNPNCWRHKHNMDEFECILLDEGMWTSRHDAFMLTCVKYGLV